MEKSPEQLLPVLALLLLQRTLLGLLGDRLLVVVDAADADLLSTDIKRLSRIELKGNKHLIKSHTYTNL